MTVYLSARYQRRDEMRSLRERINAIPGCAVQSTWLDMPDDASPQECADIDLDEVAKSDLLIAFTEEPGVPSTGGRHVEYGVALACGVETWVVGPSENVFHSLVGRKYGHAEVMLAHLAWITDAGKRAVEAESRLLTFGEIPNAATIS